MSGKAHPLEGRSHDVQLTFCSENNLENRPRHNADPGGAHRLRRAVTHGDACPHRHPDTTANSYPCSNGHAGSYRQANVHNNAKANRHATATTYHNVHPGATANRNANSSAIPNVNANPNASSHLGNAQEHRLS